MRLPTKCWTAAWKTAILLLGMVVVPVLDASAGNRRLWRDCPPGSSPSGNVVYRPAYPGPRTKTFYLSNYAGVNYPPVVRRPRLEPTAATYPVSRNCPACVAGTHAHP